MSRRWLIIGLPPRPCRPRRRAVRDRRVAARAPRCRAQRPRDARGDAAAAARARGRAALEVRGPKLTPKRRRTRSRRDRPADRQADDAPKVTECPRSPAAARAPRSVPGSARPATAPTGTCTENCGPAERRHAVCGNGSREEGEACDDGNRTSGDGCSATCTGEPAEGRDRAAVPDDVDPAQPATPRSTHRTTTRR